MGRLISLSPLSSLTVAFESNNKEAASIRFFMSFVSFNNLFIRFSFSAINSSFILSEPCNKAEYPLFQYKNGYYSNSGSFNFIYVDNDYKGRKILVADRNIQNYISAHKLVNSGITSITGIPYVMVVNPILSYETSHSTIGVAICSSTAYPDGSRAAWRAFSGNPQDSWMSKTVPEWLGFQ